MERLGEIGRGDDAVEASAAERYVHDDEWLVAWCDAAAGAVDAWTADASLERIVRLPWAELPGRAVLDVYLNELTVHTWDLATATDQHPTWDDEVVTVAFDAVRLLAMGGAFRASDAVSTTTPGWGARTCRPTPRPYSPMPMRRSSCVSWSGTVAGPDGNPGQRPVVKGRMKLHRLALVALPAALLLVACGDSDAVSTTPDTTVAGIDHPTGPDDVVLQLTVAGGFVPVEQAFGNVPSVTIYGDGRVITPGATTMIFPGPLVGPLFQQTMTEDGIQQVLAAADAAGLLAEPPSYESAAADRVADLPTTELVINAAGGQWTHSAYALGEANDTPERQQLLDFVTSLGDLSTLAGPDSLGAPEPYVADQYRIRATPDPEESEDVEPTLVAWPEPTVDLASATECAVAGGPAVTAAFAEATQLTWFTQDGVTYSLLVRPLLPGDQGC